jgi:DNA topoisomerase-1
MRTDSTRLANEALGAIRGFIGEQFGADYLPEQPQFYGKSKGAQDAHEAVRPTDVRRTPDSVKAHLDKESLALYTLIWNRAVASQMKPAQFERTRVEVPVGRYLFIATGSVVKFKGYLAVYEEAKDEIGQSESDAEGAEQVENEGDTRLPPLVQGEKLKVSELAGAQHFTQPPPRFTEASLVKELEKQGIGRPSTYASIISTIQDRGYSEKDKGSFRPTELGFIITDLLSASFPQVMDVKFTALMESQLDEVEEGKVDWVQLLESFYRPFVQRLEKANEEMRNLKAEVTPTQYVCDKCGSPMVVRWGRNGKFLACSAFRNAGTRSRSRRTKQGKCGSSRTRRRISNARTAAGPW